MSMMPLRGVTRIDRRLVHPSTKKKARFRKAVLTPTHTSQMQRLPALRFSATVGEEPEIELALV